MQNDFLSSKLEISVKKVDGVFKATCKLFPDTTGFGKSEKEAIEDLADVIATKMGDMVKGSIDDILKNDVFNKVRIKRLKKTEPIDPFTDIKKVNKNKDSKVLNEKSVFTVPSIDILFKNKGISKNSNMSSLFKGGTMIMGLRPINQKDKMPSETEEHYLDEIFDSLSNNGFFESQELEEVRTPFGVLLGIPISFN